MMRFSFGNQHPNVWSLYKRWFASDNGGAGEQRAIAGAAKSDATLDMTGLFRVSPSSASDNELLRLAALGRMTTGIVHDFGNLLQVATSAIRLMESGMDQPDPASLWPLVRGVSASIDRAASLSRQILMFSRAREVCEEVIFVEPALAAIKTPITWMLGPEVKVEFKLDDDLPGIFCDCREFENAILNLVINAKDAMPSGGRLRIECFCETAMNAYAHEGAPGRTLVLRVTDNGEGMSPVTAGNAFKAYYTTKTCERGNGLGLAMVSDFMRRAGGSAKIESELGSGTTVVLRFPVAQEWNAPDSPI